MKIKTFLLICGIVASILFIITDIYSAMIWREYSYIDQSVSELSAIGAPTRSIWVIMTFVCNPLFILNGIGVWKSAQQKLSLKIDGFLISFWGLFGFFWLLFPMNLRGSIGSATDTMHLVMAGLNVIIIILFISFGSVAGGKKFRWYSILTIISLFGFGFLTGIQAPQVAAQLPTPWMGVTERVSVYLTYMWVMMLSIVFLRTKKGVFSIYE